MMKRSSRSLLVLLLLVLSILLPMSFLQAAGVWTYVGTPGISEGDASELSLALDEADIPYVAYTDSANDRKVSVLRYNGSAWTPLCMSGCSEGAADYQNLRYNHPMHQIYLAYRDAAYDFAATVQRYNGSSWSTVGSPGFTPGSAEFESLAFTSTGTAYIAFRDDAHSGKISVMSYNGESWENIGPSGFSSGTIRYSSLAFDSDDTPYVAYEDIANGNKVTVKKFVLGAWVTVGSVGFSPHQANDEVILQMNAENIPYIIYNDGDNNGQLTAMKYTGASWEVVGSEDFSPFYASYLGFVIDATGVPYVLMSSEAGMNVMKYDGVAWVSVGSENFVQGAYGSLALDSSGRPYAAFRDEENKASVMYLGYPPAQVTGLSATALSPRTISLTWSTPTSPDAGIVGYKIERESPLGAGFEVVVGNTSSSETTYVDDARTPETTYAYRVSAINSIGIGATSSEAHVTTPMASAIAQGGGTIDLNYLDPPRLGQIIFSVDENASSTVSSTVHLHIQTGNDVVSMAISRTEDFSSVSIEPLREHVPWVLCSDCVPGFYPVYLKLYTKYGQVSTLRKTINYQPIPSLQKIGGATIFSNEFRTVSTTRIVFVRNLRPGMKGEDVRSLQHYLNVHGFSVAVAGNGSRGHETNYYGIGTKKAVAAFQRQNAAFIGPVVSSGVFSESTRVFLNLHP